MTTAVPGWGPPALSNNSADGHGVLVPYRYGGDAAAGLDWTEMRGDTGADVSESVQSLAARALDGYLAESFAHSVGGLSLPKYASHFRDGIIDPIRQEALTAAWDLIAAHDYFGADPSFGSFIANEPGSLSNAPAQSPHDGGQHSGSADRDAGGRILRPCETIRRLGAAGSCQRCWCLAGEPGFGCWPRLHVSVGHEPSASVVRPARARRLLL